MTSTCSGPSRVKRIVHERAFAWRQHVDEGFERDAERRDLDGGRQVVDAGRRFDRDDEVLARRGLIRSAQPNDLRAERLDEAQAVERGRAQVVDQPADVRGRRLGCRR